MAISKVNESSRFTDKKGGGQNTDPQSMDYPKADYATEV